jgi:hypothetical protein
MPVLEKLDLDNLTPSRLWSALEEEERAEAARSLYASDNRDYKLEADMAIAVNLKFRPATVQRLPAEKRAGYIARAVRPDESLATTLLLSMHLEERRDLLVTFLDVLEIPNDNGMIDERFDLTAPDEQKLAAAVETLEQSYPADRVGLYLAALLAVDPPVWGGVRKHLARIRGL